jgi:F-type H+-transporting ATPase subunit b
MPQISQLSAIYASQIFWLLVVFGIIYFFIGRGMVPKIEATVDKRDHQIAEDLAAAERARKSAEATEADYTARIVEARAVALKATQEIVQRLSGIAIDRDTAAAAARDALAA